jgi:hypothetical protein
MNKMPCLPLSLNNDMTLDPSETLDWLQERLGLNDEHSDLRRIKGVSKGQWDA